MNSGIVIIPTYNEKENIAKLIPEIIAQNLPLDILVIDDNSPDGTSQVAGKLIIQFPQIHLITRTGKLGFASAYLTGFKYALEHGYQFIWQMDADLSHQPKYLQDFWQKIQESDLVVGSRYVPGGGIEGWPWFRLFLSKFASLYAQIILGVKLKDFTGGYNCYRREVLEAIDLAKIISQGYSFLLELKYKTILRNFKYCEIPIIFVERQQGKSKISRKIIWEAAINCWKLRFGL